MRIAGIRAIVSFLDDGRHLRRDRASYMGRLMNDGQTSYVGRRSDVPEIQGCQFTVLTDEVVAELLPPR